MDIKEHKKKFDQIVLKYKLNSDEKSMEIAQFLTNSQDNKKISSKEFATLFAMDEKDAEIFLSFIQKGLEFKQKSN